MKDTEVHNGLDGKEMRDFYQETLVSYNAKQSAIDKLLVEERQAVYKLHRNDKFGVLRRNIDRLSVESKHTQESLKMAECILGLFLTMDGLNWKDHDMSDYISCSGEHYRSFIGTQEEFDNFIKQFDNKDE